MLPRNGGEDSEHLQLWLDDGASDSRNDRMLTRLVRKRNKHSHRPSDHCNQDDLHGGEHSYGTLAAMLACKQVTTLIGTTTILADVSFTLEPGGCLCIVGPSGSGKTLLSRLLVRAEVPTSGTIEVDGVDLVGLPPPILQLYRSRVGLLFQEPLLLAHMTLQENLAYPLELRGLPDAACQQAALALLAGIGLAENAASLPHILSQGERSLLCVARATIADPMIIIADEPFAHLDRQQREKATDLLRGTHTRGASLLLLSQDAATGTSFGARTLSLAVGRISAEEGGFSPAPVAGNYHILDASVQESPLQAPAEKTAPALQPETEEAAKKTVKAHRERKKIRITSIGS